MIKKFICMVVLSGLFALFCCHPLTRGQTYKECEDGVLWTDYDCEKSSESCATKGCIAGGYCSWDQKTYAAFEWNEFTAWGTCKYAPEEEGSGGLVKTYQCAKCVYFYCARGQNYLANESGKCVYPQDSCFYVLGKKDSCPTK